MFYVLLGGTAACGGLTNNRFVAPRKQSGPAVFRQAEVGRRHNVFILRVIASDRGVK